MKQKLRALSQRLVILTILVMLTGCASLFRDNSNQMSFTVQDYLLKASETSGAQSQQYQMLAINQLITDNNINDAEQLLKTLRTINLDPTIKPQKSIVEAQLALKQNKPQVAIRKLATVNNTNQLPSQIITAYYTTLTEAYHRNNDLADSTIARIRLNATLTDSDIIQKNEIIIWRSLQTLSTPTLNRLLKNSSDPLINGWLTLAISSKQFANNPSSLATQIQNWQTANPGHPANSLLPDANTLQSLPSIQPPKQIALLLPIHGQFGNLGQAVRDGFMTAFYANVKQLSSSPAIKVYDTSQSDNMADLYRQAIQEGADFVIGPLTKSNVDQLVNRGDISVPTLTLNFSSHGSVPNNVIQFGFSPEQAAQQAAEFAWQHNITQALIITPNSDWGKNIADAFNTQWNNSGGQTAGMLSFDNATQLSDEISSLLNITDSKARTDELSQLFSKKIKSTLRRRQDINGIFLAATPADARQILPLLKFYYAGNLPVISIANIYTGYPSSQNDHDLNDVYFDDMPWLFDTTPYMNQLKTQIQSLWKENYAKNSRLYGLGIDAYTISILLPRLISLPNFALQGVTGQLYLQQDHTIYQQLSWARFSQGIPRAV